MVFKWCDSHTDMFLNKYRETDLLWDRANPLYKNRGAREEAYGDIVAIFNEPQLTIRDVQNKIKTLRTNYKSELNKVLRAQRDSEIYVPQVFWFKKADSFLRSVCANSGLGSANSDCPDDDTSFSITDEYSTLESDFQISDIKLEDTMIEEANTKQQITNTVQTNKIRKIYRRERERESPESSEILTTRIPSSFYPERRVSPNDIAFPPRPRRSYVVAQTVIEPINERTATHTDTMASTRNAARKRRSHIIALNKGISKLQRTIDHRNDNAEDEFDLFGKIIAMQLKRMPLERALVCQEGLQKVITLERLHQLRS